MEQLNLFFLRLHWDLQVDDKLPLSGIIFATAMGCAGRMRLCCTNREGFPVRLHGFSQDG